MNSEMTPEEHVRFLGILAQMPVRDQLWMLGYMVTKDTDLAVEAFAELGMSKMRKLG